MYVILMRMTDRGLSDIKSAPQRMEEGIKAWEAMGGTVHSLVATMGEYDYVGVGEGLSDEAAVTFAAGLASKGYVTTTTMRAFTKEECATIFERLP
jgi:uncharacterized protein with GYD domain